MDKKETEKLLLGIANMDPVIVDIVISKPNILEKLFKKESKQIKLYPLVLNDLIEVTKILIEIPEYSFDGKTDNKLFLESLDLITNHAEKFLKVISIFTGLKEKFLNRNLTTEDILKLIQLVVKMSDIQNFMISIALTRATASLKS